MPHKNPALNGTSQLSNVLETPDPNYLEEVTKPPYAGKELKDGLDEKVGRKWIDDVVMKMPRAPPAASRRRPLASVNAENIDITSGQLTYNVRVYVPSTAKKTGNPVLIMIHGGGWIHGYPEVDEDVSVFFASELRAVVVSVNYALAPEHKFPVAHDECYHTIEWCIANADQYGIDTSRIGVWGCSAGGNLAAGIALRDAEEHETTRLCHVQLAVPATCHPDEYPPELNSERASTSMFGGEPGRHAIGTLLEKYAGDKTGHRHVSVLRAPIPPNHAPVHVTVGGMDFLRDEGIIYAMRLRGAGIDAQLDVIPGVPHGITFPPTTHAATQCFRDQARVLDYALNYVS